MIKINLVEEVLKQLQVNPERLRSEWISAAEGPRFAEAITTFGDHMTALGPMGSHEGLDRDLLFRKLQAAKQAMEQVKVRLAYARKAKEMKDGEAYRELSEDHRLNHKLESALSHEIAKQGVLLHLQQEPRTVDELCILLDLSAENVEAHISELEKEALIDKEKMILS